LFRVAHSFEVLASRLCGLANILRPKGACDHPTVAAASPIADERLIYTKTPKAAQPFLGQEKQECLCCVENNAWPK
jgi:hypothetical protein